jgi:Helicase
VGLEVPDQAAADAAQDDLGAFARLIGRPLAPFQVEALTLETRHTALLAPRQTGKSFSLAVLVAWWVYSRPGQQVLMISNREDTAKSLLKVVRDVARHPLLRMSVTEDLKTRLELSNGSAVEAVPQSEAAVRGRSNDLVVIDEAAFVDDELIQAAALPTTMARPDARIVLASTPWGRGGTFFSWHQAGLDGSDPDVAAFTWRLADAAWIVPSVVESLRRTMHPLRFRAEVLGEWVGSGDGFFDPADIDAAVAGYPMVRDGGGAPAVLGADWGRDRDSHAVVICGVLDDGGVNRRPVVVVPWCEASRRGYGEQENEIAGLAARWDLTVLSEAKGVGIPSTENLRNRLRCRVIAVKTTQEIKEQAYARLQNLLSERSIVLPDHAGLRKQLAGIVARPTPLGGLKIEARTQAIHDDLADALAFAVWGLPAELAAPPERDWPEGTAWAQTPGGIRVPLPVATVRAERSWLNANSDMVTCPGCGHGYPVGRSSCLYCGKENADYMPPRGNGSAILAASASRPAAGAPAAAGSSGTNAQAGPVRVENMYAPGGYLWRCPRGHTYSAPGDAPPCPACQGGVMTFLKNQGRPPGLGGGFGGMGGLRGLAGIR